MFRSIAITLALSLVTVAANAALIGADPLTPGGTDYQAFYDSTQNISWVADANLASTSGYCGVAGNCSGSLMIWSQVQAWITSLNTANYLGVNNWRLPTTGQPDPTCDTHYSDPRVDLGANCTGSEMGHLYNVDGVTAATPGLFSNLQPSAYWSGTEYGPGTSLAWIFGFGPGSQGIGSESGTYYAWAVAPGDIAAVPLPPAAFLFPSAIGLLGWVRRKRQGTRMSVAGKQS